MPTFLHILRYWSLLASLAIIFSVYFIVIGNSGEEHYSENQYRIGMKKIVAYSLLKQIEMESEEYNCNAVYRNNSGYVKRDDSEENDTATRDFDEDNWTHIENTNLYISSVNLDQRLDPYHYIRIIGMVKGRLGEPPLCQIQTQSGVYHFVKSTLQPIWYKEWNQNNKHQYYDPVLLSCKIPFGEKAIRVSITTKPCEITHYPTFTVKYNEKACERNFTVCVKPLDFREDISYHLIQWIEVLKILGADKINFYVKKLKRNTLKVLKWYAEKTSTVEVRLFGNLPSKGVNNSSKIWQKRKYEIVAYNNCFYRNLAESKFIVPLDIDEIIVPKIAPTWNELIEKVGVKNVDEFASLTVSNAYFFRKQRNMKVNSFEKENVFFQDILMRSNFSPRGESGKSFINTRNTLTVFNHYALNMTPGINRVYFLPTDWVQLNHYKFFCDIRLLPQCVNYLSSPRIFDNSILKVKSRFNVNYDKIMTELRKEQIL